MIIWDWLSFINWLYAKTGGACVLTNKVDILCATFLLQKVRQLGQNIAVVVVVVVSSVIVSCVVVIVVVVVGLL